MSGLFAALQELEAKYGLPPRINFSSGVESRNAGHISSALSERELIFLPTGAGSSARPTESNFSSVPVPDDKAESNHALRDDSPRANDSIGNGARAGTPKLRHNTSVDAGSGDTLGAAGNILSGEMGSQTRLATFDESQSKPCSSSDGKRPVGDESEVPKVAGDIVTIPPVNASPITAVSVPAQDPFTPTMFRAMIRQQCLGEAR